MLSLQSEGQTSTPSKSCRVVCGALPPIQEVEELQMSHVNLTFDTHILPEGEENTPSQLEATLNACHEHTTPSSLESSNPGVDVCHE